MLSMRCEIMPGMVILMIIRTYSELIRLPTFEERFKYLKLNGAVGVETFGYDRIFNQRFYTSIEWRNIRDYVITRDNGRDLAMEGYEIRGQGIYIHHLNPITLDDIDRRSEILLDPEFLITTVHRTHNAIHYGDEKLLSTGPIVRTRNDTCPWRRN